MIIVALIAVPALVNPRGQDGFAVVKAALIQVLGPLAGLCAALAVWRDRRRWRTSALVAAIGVAGLVWIVATAFGVAPMLSFFAPGARHEGTFVMLSLVAIGFATATLDREHLDAIVTAAIIGSIGPSIFAIAQTIAHSATSAAVREVLPPTGGTLGNPVLLGGYLVTVIPLTLTRALGLAIGFPPDTDPRESAQSTVRGLRRAGVLWTIFVLQMAALLVTRARGAWISTLIASLIVAIAAVDVATARGRRLVWISGLVLAIALVSSVIFVQVRHGTLVAGRTLQVRVMIWKEVVRLLNARRDRLLIGYGPEMLQSVVGPYHSAELVLLEGGFAVPDRAHNELLDMLVSAGVLGLTAIVTLHLLFWGRLIARVRALRKRSYSWWLAVGLLAAGVAHFIEIQAGIATIPSRLVWWSCVGIAAGWQREDAERVSQPPEDPSRTWWASLAAGTAMAVLAFDFWQPGAGPSTAGVIVTIATGAIALAAGAPARSALHPGRAAAPIATAGAVLLTMLLALTLWDAATPRLHSGGVRELVEIGNWTSHQSTVVLLLFAGLGCTVAYGLGRPRDSRRGRHLLAYSAVVVLTWVLIAVSARAARADVLAYIAGEMQSAQRWPEAVALQQQRVQLTPESDLAWAALGGAELELARLAGEGDRAGYFERATATLAEARRRNPFDWSHIRDQASAERLWAAADRAGRSAHLRAADRRFQEATTLAPAFPRLWAEWGNVSAERGDLHDAFAKLDWAMTLHGEGDAEVVANAILRATGFDLLNPTGRARAAAQLEADGFHNLARWYRR